FLISQKALWYFAACNAAWMICCMMFPQGYYSVRQLCRLNYYALLPIVIYIGFWSCFSSIPIVMDSLFREAYIQSGINWYEPIYYACWNVMLHYGPALFLLWPLTFISLNRAIAPHPSNQQRVFILSMSSCFLLLFIHYKQAFPYNFVFTVPAFYLLYADFFSWLQTANHYRIITIKTAALFSVCFFLVINLLSLPLSYNLLVLLPFLLYKKNNHPQRVY